METGNTYSNSCCYRSANTNKQIIEDYLSLMLTVMSIKLNIKLAQGFPKVLRKEKSEPWAIDVLVH